MLRLPTPTRRPSPVASKARRSTWGRRAFLHSPAVESPELPPVFGPAAGNSVGFSGLVNYGTAKTAQILTMLKFGDYFRGSSVSINAMHPGNVRTNLGENNGRLYRLFKHRIVNPSARDPQIAATALYYLGVSRDIEGMSGRFFNLTEEERPAPHARDGEMAEKIWNLSIELGGLE